MAGEGRMWGCVGWRAVVAHSRNAATPDVPQDLRHLYGPLQWGCQEGQAVPGSPVGVSLCPLQCWSISDPTSPLGVLLPHHSTGRSYWSVPREGVGQDGQWICTGCPFLPGPLSSAVHRKGIGHRGISFHLALSSQPLFSEKKCTPCLAVSKTTVFCRKSPSVCLDFLCWWEGALHLQVQKQPVCSIVSHYSSGKLVLPFSCPCSAG